MKLNNMKILNSKSKNFDKLLENLLFQRKKKIQSDSVSVTNIIKDVKNNGDKALLKYCLLYTSPSPRDQRGSRMPSSA